MKLKIETATEFTFDVKWKSSNERVKFYKELFGYKNSPYGKYTYIKDGILSDANYLKPARSTLIVPSKEAKELRNFLKKHKAEFDEKILFLKKEQAEKLGIKTPKEWKNAYEEIKEKAQIKIDTEFDQ